MTPLVYRAMRGRPRIEPTSKERRAQLAVCDLTDSLDEARQVLEMLGLLRGLHTGRPHYRHGCRHPTCTAAEREYQQNYHQQLRARKADQNA